MTHKSTLRKQLEGLAVNTRGVADSEWTIDLAIASYRFFRSGGGWRIFFHPWQSPAGESIGFENKKDDVFAFIENHIQEQVKAHEEARMRSMEPFYP